MGFGFVANELPSPSFGTEGTVGIPPERAPPKPPEPPAVVKVDRGVGLGVPPPWEPDPLFELGFEAGERLVLESFLLASTPGNDGGFLRVLVDFSSELFAFFASFPCLVGSVFFVPWSSPSVSPLSPAFTNS